MPAGSGDVLVMAKPGGLIVSPNPLLAIIPPPSLTCAVKLKVPELVGVPLNTPLLLKVNPPGKVPALTVQLYGSVPPEAVSVCEYETPTVPVGNGELVVIANAAGLIVNAKLLVADLPALSASRTLKLKLPAFVGVPLKTPVLLKPSPPGNVPELSDQVYGDVPPDATKVCE